MVVGRSEKTLTVKVETADGSKVLVEGASPAEIQGDFSAQTLRITNPDRIVKIIKSASDIVGLDCGKNQLTALDVRGLSALDKLECYGNRLTSFNVSGCTALQVLYCFGNRLEAAAFTSICNALPTRDASNNSGCYLYSEEEGEGNHKDFTAPDELKNAFDKAKKRNWSMRKFTDISTWTSKPI